MLVLSQYLESRYALRLLESYPERIGYLLKDRVSEIAALGGAIRRIAGGECVIDPTIVSRLMKRRRSDGPLAVLSEEEQSSSRWWPKDTRTMRSERSFGSTRRNWRPGYGSSSTSSTWMRAQAEFAALYPCCTCCAGRLSGLSARSTLPTQEESHGAE